MFPYQKNNFCYSPNKIKGEEWIWVKPNVPKTNGEFDVAFAAKIQSTSGDKLLVTDDDGNELWITKDQVSFNY